MAKLLITGCGRSGTMYMSQLLRHYGMDVGHETLGADGAIGWFYAAKQKWLGYGVGNGSRAEVEFAPILHQIRHPLKVIASTQWMHQLQWEFIRGEIDILPRDDLLYCAASFWLRWNRLAARVACWSYRIEDITPSSAVFGEFADRVGLDRSISFPAISQNTNHKEDVAPVMWDALDAIPRLRDEIMEYARTFGYE